MDPSVNDAVLLYSGEQAGVGDGGWPGETREQLVDLQTASKIRLS